MAWTDRACTGRVDRRGGVGGLVGAISPPGLRCFFVFAEGGRQRRALPVAVGRVSALPSASGGGRTGCDAAGLRVERLHGVGAERRSAGRVRVDRWPCDAAAALYRRQPRELPLHLLARDRCCNDSAGPPASLVAAA